MSGGGSRWVDGAAQKDNPISGHVISVFDAHFPFIHIKTQNEANFWRNSRKRVSETLKKGEVKKGFHN